MVTLNMQSCEKWSFSVFSLGVFKYMDYDSIGIH